MLIFASSQKDMKHNKRSAYFVDLNFPKNVLILLNSKEICTFFHPKYNCFSELSRHFEMKDGVDIYLIKGGKGIQRQSMRICILMCESVVDEG